MVFRDGDNFVKLLQEYTCIRHITHSFATREMKNYIIFSLQKNACCVKNKTQQQLHLFVERLKIGQRVMN